MLSLSNNMSSSNQVKHHTQNVLHIGKLWPNKSENNHILTTIRCFIIQITSEDTWLCSTCINSSRKTSVRGSPTYTPTAYQNLQTISTPTAPILIYSATCLFTHYLAINTQGLNKSKLSNSSKSSTHYSSFSPHIHSTSNSINSHKAHNVII